MTKDASFKKVVRRHAEETGQRYTEALTDLEGLGARMHHEPVPDRLLAHLRDRYGIDPAAATKLSVHKTYVFRIDRNDGSPWVARAFPPARPRAGVEGDAAILRFLERQDYPADRLAADDAVSDFDGSAVLVTRFVEGASSSHPSTSAPPPLKSEPRSAGRSSVRPGNDGGSAAARRKSHSRMQFPCGRCGLSCRADTAGIRHRAQVAKPPKSVLHRVPSTLAMPKASARSIVQRARSADLG
jgi:hypothetical protein